MTNTNVGKQLRYLCHYSYHIINAILEEGYDGFSPLSNLLFLKQALTLFRMGDHKGPTTSFPPVTSTNVRFDPENFLNFSFNPFATVVQNFKLVPSVSPKLLNVNQDRPSKKAIFLVKSS